MKRFLIFISLHLFLFVLVIAYQAQADDEEWTIDKYKSLSYARVSGEVIHGDNLNFFIGNKVILLPIYNDKKDIKVFKIFKRFFNNRKIITIDCSKLIWGFGAVHCMTQQEPDI